MGLNLITLIIKKNYKKLLVWTDMYTSLWYPVSTLFHKIILSYDNGPICITGFLLAENVFQQFGLLSHGWVFVREKTQMGLFKQVDRQKSWNTAPGFWQVWNTPERTLNGTPSTKQQGLQGKKAQGNIQEPQNASWRLSQFWSCWEVCALRAEQSCHISKNQSKPYNKEMSFTFPGI